MKRHLQRALESLEGEGSDGSTIERARFMNNIGVACASLGNLNEAERWYTKALETAPHRISFRNLFGIYSERQESHAARRVLDQWLEIFPDDDEGALRLAIQLAKKNDVARGISELRRLTQSDSVSVQAYAALGYVLTDFSRKMDEAIEALEEGCEQHPQNTAIVNNLAYAYLMNGMASEARRVLERVPKKDVESSVYLIATWGLLFLFEGDLQAAQRHYDRAAVVAKQKGLNSLAQTVRQKMHLELARHYRRRAIRSVLAWRLEKGLRSWGRRDT